MRRDAAGRARAAARPRRNHSRKPTGLDPSYRARATRTTTEGKCPTMRAGQGSVKAALDSCLHVTHGRRSLGSDMRRFKIGATSFVYPAGWLANVERLA